MKISEKDRGQLLRMAGNIACGLVAGRSPYLDGNNCEDNVAEVSARIAMWTLLSVDRLIAELAKDGE